MTVRKRDKTIPREHRERINLHLRQYCDLLRAQARFLTAPQEIPIEKVLAKIDESMASYRGFWRAKAYLWAARLPGGLQGAAEAWLEEMYKAIDELTEAQRLLLRGLAASAGPWTTAGEP